MPKATAPASQSQVSNTALPAVTQYEPPRPRLLSSSQPLLDDSAWGSPGSDRPWQQTLLWDGLEHGLVTAIASDRSNLQRTIRTDGVLLWGDHASLIALADGLEGRNQSLAAQLLRQVVDAPACDRSVLCRGRVLSCDTTRIAGILNRTPDSFYDGGRYANLQAAFRRADEMEAEGADIVEVGGERAGPGAPVDVDEELERVIPVIATIRRHSDVLIAVDTRRPLVARRSAEAGASILNSIDGMRNPELRRVAAETGMAAVVMHIQGEPRVQQPNPTYESVMGDITKFLDAQVKDCLEDGVDSRSIIIDPGPSFGKTTAHDLAALQALGELRGFPHPVMLAVSRKRFIGDILGLPPAELLEGSLATVAYGAVRGCEIVRTHDVQATRRVTTMVDALMSGRVTQAEMVG